MTAPLKIATDPFLGIPETSAPHWIEPIAKLTTGFGQFHTNEPGKANRRPYLGIDLDSIRALVDNPQQIDKAEAQWLIPSTLRSRTFKEQEAHGEFWLLWADIDQTPPTLEAVESALAWGILCGHDFEIYTSRSAREDYQKARILIPLSKPLSGGDWLICQQILNDGLESSGIIPDRKSEGCAQLCYLPNRGEYYDTRSCREGLLLNPLIDWAQEIALKRAEKAQEAARAALRKAEAQKKREARVAQGNDSLIDAFNAAHDVGDILIQAGYDQDGTRNRYRHPRSESGSYSASVKDGRVHSLSSADPLYTDGAGAHDAFSAFCILFHHGDQNQAMKDAGDNWLTINGEPWNAVKQREFKAQSDFSLASELSKPSQISVLDAIKRMSVRGKSQELKMKMLDDVYVIQDLAILGQWTVFFAAPNTGKTLLTMRFVSDSINAGIINGESVFFINADDGYRGAVEKTEIAEEFGFHMLIPGQGDFKPERLIPMMCDLVRVGEAKGVVFILDTLKKFVDPMEKSKQTEFGKKVREFVLAGGTIICLAHVNKNKDADGRSIRSGTSDILDDADCAFIIDVLTEGEDGEKAVIFRNTKARGDVAQERSYKFIKRKGMGYRALFDSVQAMDEAESQRAKKEQITRKHEESDAAIIEAIREILVKSSEDVCKTELMKAIVEQGYARQKTNAVYGRWLGHHWTESKSERNTKLVKPYPDYRKVIPAMNTREEVTR